MYIVNKKQKKFKICYVYNYNRSCIATSFGIGFIIIFVLKYSKKCRRTFLVGRNNYTPFLNMVNIFFGGSVVRLPTRNFARTVFCIWIVACTVIRSAYQGAIFDFIKKSKNAASVNTVSELIQHDYTLYVNSLTLNIFKFPPDLREKYTVFFAYGKKKKKKILTPVL